MESQSTEIQVSSSPSLSYQETTVMPMIKVAFTIIIIFAAISAIMTIFYDCLPKQQRRFFVFKPLFEAPCDRCRYLSGNSYLKCALHPSVVLTAKAMDCKDYRPKQENKLVRSSRRLLEAIQNMLLR
jgi:hypothetical protein